MARRVAVLILGLSLVSLSAYAQRGDSGSIVGYVMDQSGNAIKGVKIIATSPTQIGGRKVVYSSDEGSFRFSQLVPGTFEVKAEAPKLTTAIQTGLKVGINGATEITLIMEVATSAVEEVKITQKAPLVSTTTPNVKEVYDVDFVDSLPHDNRDQIFNQITNYTAGAIRGGRIRGGGATQTLLLMDGFNMFRQWPTVKASAAYEVQSAAYGAENSTASGGVVNLVSRSGSNKFEFEIQGTGENDKMRFFQDGTDPKTSTFFYILNPTISGPIVKDRLWFSFNTELLTRKTGREGDIEGIVPDPLPELRNWFKGTAKVTWQVSQRNKLTSVSNFDEFWQHNKTATLGYTKEAQARGRSRKYFTGLIWESLLTDKILFRSQAGFVSANDHTMPLSCDEDPIECNNVPGIRQKAPRDVWYQNAPLRDRKINYSFQFVNRLEFFFDSKSLGEHNIQLKDDVSGKSETDGRLVPGDRVEEYNGLVPDQATFYYANDPRLEEARYGWWFNNRLSLINSLALTDSWRPTRFLTVTPGGSFVYARAENNRAEGNIIQQAITPSIAVAWDATHDGRTVVRGSFNQYVDVDLSPLATHTVGSQVQQRCKWDAALGTYSKDCVYSGGASSATIGSPCGPSGIDPATGADCRTGLKVPRTTEYTFGGEREVVEGLSLGLDFIYRQFSNQYEKIETNRIWNAQGSALESGGGYRDGRNRTVDDLETPNNAQRRYVGVTGAVTRREGKFKLRAAYTWSRLDGTVLEGTGNRLGDISSRDVFLDGPLADDHRHEVKLNAAYQFTRWFSTSLRYAYYSGTPYSRFFYNNELGGYEDLRAVVGVNPGANVNDPGDDRQLRLPDFQTFNAQLSFNWEPLIRQRLETFIDVLNVLGTRTVTGVTENDGGGFGVSRTRDEPLRIRLGFRYRY
jgi:hypothetical protein